MLIVENGTCPAGANSYVSLEEADAYLVPRGLWPDTLLTDTETDTVEGQNGDAMQTPDTVMLKAKEQALIRAFDCLNGLDWKGYKLDWERVPAWPRLNVPMPGTPPALARYIPDDVVPQVVRQAQMELAGLAYGGRDLLAPVERGGAVIAESHSTSEGNVDVIGGDSESHSYTYKDSAPMEAWLPSVYPLLKPLLFTVPGQNEGFRMVRVWPG